MFAVSTDDPDAARITVRPKQHCENTITLSLNAEAIDAGAR